jgi:hypothetical protein
MLLAYRVTLPTYGVEPVLSISRSNNMVRLSWPPAYSNFVLQSTETLAAPTWSPVASNSTNYTTVTTNDTRFFRLVSP